MCPAGLKPGPLKPALAGEICRDDGIVQSVSVMRRSWSTGTAGSVSYRPRFLRRGPFLGGLRVTYKGFVGILPVLRLIKASYTLPSAPRYPLTGLAVSRKVVLHHNE